MINKAVAQSSSANIHIRKMVMSQTVGIVYCGPTAVRSDG